VRPWREYVDDPIAHARGLSASFEEWVREKLTGLAPSHIRLETNLGGLDEAGTFSPDFDWAGMVAAEFPAHHVEIRYLLPQGREERDTPYFVQLEITGQGVLRAEVHVQRPGAWMICEERVHKDGPSSRGELPVRPGGSACFAGTD
jgi:hypothetical protein